MNTTGKNIAKSIELNNINLVDYFALVVGSQFR